MKTSNEETQVGNDGGAEDPYNKPQEGWSDGQKHCGTTPDQQIYNTEDLVEVSGDGIVDKEDKIGSQTKNNSRRR